ncbi:MAG: ATP-dependent 6-phosphofructokinase [Erysipelotrichaceae bacterium]|nr:ATP-dependent 6-phosphofructokinase [Erysipelotrichaceae bacterium]
MVKRIGILTSGGDCAGLNATMRGVVLAADQLMDCEFYGIQNGFEGLMHGEIAKMEVSDFADILELGGTILHSHRTPFKRMRIIEDGFDKVKAMIDNYQKFELDCLVCLGGAGTHKNANMLKGEGLNVIALPKTIDNDIFGTELSFGFSTAVEIATDVIDRVVTTARSHDRVMVVEIMGNKTGWLALNSAIATKADMVLIPEIPYDEEKIVKSIREIKDGGKRYAIVVVAEGAKSIDEAAMSKKDYLKLWETYPEKDVGARIVNLITKSTGLEGRLVKPGHQLRGGTPNCADRVLSTKIGVFAAQLIKDEKFGKAVSIRKNKCIASPLEDIAGKTKKIPVDGELVATARLTGIKFGD